MIPEELAETRYLLARALRTMSSDPEHFEALDVMLTFFEALNPTRQCARYKLRYKILCRSERKRGEGLAEIKFSTH